MTRSPGGVVRIVGGVLGSYPPKHGGDHGKAGQHGQHEEGGFHKAGFSNPNGLAVKLQPERGL